MSSPESSLQDGVQELRVFAKTLLHQGSVFGPFKGEMAQGQLTCFRYAWAIKESDTYCYIDASDENKSNWMRFVSCTTSEEEHNLIVFQWQREIYYRVSKPISPGEEVKVCIGKEYAALLGLGLGESIKCKYGDKENLLSIFQDIQLVRVPGVAAFPEPHDSPSWFNGNQSYINMSGTSSLSSRSQADSNDPNQCSAMEVQDYDFVEGADKLLKHPNTAQVRVWYFFGFEADPSGSGLPLDKTRSSTQPSRPATQTTNAIADFLIRDLLPPSMVEGEGFRQMIRTLLPSNQELPSAWQLGGLLTDLHAREKKIRTKTFTTYAGSAEEKDSKHTTIQSKSGTISRTKASCAGTSQVLEPNYVTLSADVWGRDWQGDSETYVTLWAHFLDFDFSPHTLALGTQRLWETETGKEDWTSVEAKVRSMAQEWGICQPCVVIIGGDESEKIKLMEKKESKRREQAKSALHPNSTTFLECEDSVSGDEISGSVQVNRSNLDFPLIPCFLTVVEACIRQVMSHPVISSTLGLFQSLLSSVFHSQNKNRDQSPYSRKLFTALGQQDLAELKSWTNIKPEWNRLYCVLQTLLRHQALISEVIKEKSEEFKDRRGATTTKDSVSTNSVSSDNCKISSISHISNKTIVDAVFPEPSDWKVLDDLCLVLKPLDVACNTVAKEAYPRLSLIKPILTGLLSRHLALGPGVSAILQEVKKIISTTLKSFYDNPQVNRIICLACALDPQFHGLRFMEQKDQVDTFDWLKKEAVRAEEERSSRQLESSANHRVGKNKRNSSSLLPWEMDGCPRRSKRLKEGAPISFKAEKNDDDDDEEEEMEEESEASSPGYQGEEEEEEEEVQTETMQTTESNSASGMEFLLGDLYGPQAQSKLLSVEECVDAEVSLYRAKKDSALIEQPPLQWWRAKCTVMPLLAKVARAYLAAPAVVGGAAEVFQSQGEGAMHRNRRNIPSAMLDQLLFLHHNHLSCLEQGTCI
ncbi:E3 SUMO-protein ligase ZBED1-like [Osmerus mordax]|uniref:E3 SUMO-protein ligase ZBED1-like n=1 Tax=Osmerus mordax TaxID=8014 RepID=UPI00350FAF8F